MGNRARSGSSPHDVSVFKIYAFMSLASVVLMIWSLVECVSTDQSRIRNLPKLWWILLIVFFPLAGSIAWLVAGRPETVRPAARPTAGFPEYERPGRMVAGDPAKDEDFLKNVRERAEDQRRRYEQQQRAEKAREQQERDERKRDKSPE